MRRTTLLIVEDDPLQRRLIRENLEEEGFTVYDAPDSRKAIAILREQPVDIAVVDYKLENETGLDVIREMLKVNPLITPIMVTAYGNVETAVEAMRQGAYDYITKPIDFEKFLLVIDRAGERQRLTKEVARLRETITEKFSFKNFIFSSSRMAAVARLINKAAQSDANVLISGDTGTGKDQVARIIHHTSRREAGPYLAVNIPSLPESLIESELFGAEKGAYTGAHERKIGKFEAASGGTLYLDEIGDLPVGIQVKLLRFLQDREFFRLGSAKPIHADVRVIAATNRDLEKLMQEGLFRQDLYYRLNVIRIHVPLLKERKDDISPLVDHFIRKYAEREGKAVTGISADAMNVLVQYDFPGNIRELENIIERAVVFAEDSDIVSADLPLTIKDPPDQVEIEGGSLKEKVKRIEVRAIRRALREHGGVKSRAARNLGITERVLSYKMKLYGFDNGGS